MLLEFAASLWGRDVFGAEIEKRQEVCKRNKTFSFLAFSLRQILTGVLSVEKLVQARCYSVWKSEVYKLTG